jgi:hypothetical protein
MNPATAFTDPKPATWADLDIEARAAAIQALHGLSPAAMAELLHTTRAAILGLAWRRRIPIGDHLPTRSSAFQVGNEVPAEVWAPIGKPTASPTRRQCCWPVGEATGSQQMFCGGPRARGSYCETHAAMAFRTSAGDLKYTDMLKGGKVLSGVEPGITAEEAVSIVVGRVKVEASDE